MKNISLLLLIVSLIIALPSRSKGAEGHWQAPAKEAGRKNPVPADKASLERGGKLYKTHCAACHGEKGRGDGPAGAGLTPRPADLMMMAMHHPDGDLAWKIATGRGAMPGWKSTLTADQIWDLVNFIKREM
jgi:mono/diheme cytochrome c family protein